MNYILSILTVRLWCTSSAVKIRSDSRQKICKLLFLILRTSSRQVGHLVKRFTRTAVPSIMEWHLLQCDINPDGRINPWPKLHCPISRLNLRIGFSGSTSNPCMIRRYIVLQTGVWQMYNLPFPKLWNCLRGLTKCYIIHMNMDFQI